ncbi:hypothetical protein BABINDRAFT_163244 [Babjeviella inositovora NRRL Y-12698]|uniref:Cwf19-like C-terminal domain-containing protein n=1 Tax=Babjeviella inositovora NRRL Y-12698 TaxID=984486 RepID=A0A1E3QJK5_9ASCO|nr:uncharacterized protein BABINDRAFT_163244 [Babjeviella inositovora NRRL Y-12698]ODQ77869.1 hypothetical protein BABINDRAFT_163244 [Babjeviella inositovora NRRL Y-12698]
MSDKLKFLVLNPSPANVSKLLTKANGLHAKNGPFDAVFLLGDALSCDTPSLGQLNKDVQLVPSVYFTQGLEGMNPGIASTERLADVQPNLTYLGDVGTYKLSSGVTVGFVSGKLLSAAHSDRAVMNKVLDRFQGKQVDILLTYQWPQQMADELKLTLIESNTLLSDIVKLAKPRYHFSVGSSSGKFFERSPFKWDDNESRITRFISLGQEGSASKDKWFYAFNMSVLPSVSENPLNLTENPFTKPQPVVTLKREYEAVGAETSKEIKRPKVVTQQDCFFCLSNPKLETHMIVSIGTHAYLTIAKGPLTRPSNNTDYPGFNFSGHALIIPIAHVANPRQLFKPTETKNVMETPLMNEILRYQLSLIKMFAQFGMTVVFYEISRGSGVHYHNQAIPLKTELLDVEFEKNLVKQCDFHNSKITSTNSNHSMALMNFTKHDSTDEAEMEAMTEIINNNDYVLIKLAWSAQKQVNYLFQLPADGLRIDFLFPRRVLANVLRCPKRTQWMNCKQSMGQEAEECDRFKAVYSEFDFNHNH